MRRKRIRRISKEQINQFLATIENDKIKKDYCQKYNIPLHIIKYNQNIKNRMEEILNEL